MRVAAIDIGTNSVLLLIAEKQQDRIVRVHDIATITRLGERVDETGELADAAIERTLDCLSNYAETIRAERVDVVAAVGTSAMRDAGAERFGDRAREILGITPEVISGEREAQLTFEGALTELEASGKLAVFDIGGGSTEIIVGARTGSSGSLKHAVSLDIGAVRLTERHLSSDPPTSEQLAAAHADIEAALNKGPSLEGVPLVGVAGTVTTLAAVANEVVPYSGSAVHGSLLTTADLDDLLQRFTSCGVAERKKIPGLHPKRADVIIAGTLIAQVVCERAGANRLVVSDRGVRWGLARELAFSGA